MGAAMRGVVALIACALLLEIGWFALWPLSVRLSHSPLFTSTLLQEHPVLGIWGLMPTLTDPPGSPVYVVPTSVLAVLMVCLAAVYGAALLVLERISPNHRRAALAIVLAGTFVFQLTLLPLPGLFSQDVFSYIAYGRLTNDYGLNPYIWPPSVLRDPVVSWVAEVWRSYPSPYGPLWVDLQWLLAHIGDQLSLADQALVYRAVANALLLMNVALVWRLLGRLTPLSPGQRLTSLAALAWNPLMLFEIAANAHNDVLMVTFALAALLLFGASSRGIWSTMGFAVGALVKYLSALGLVWLGLAAAARARGWPRRVLRLLGLTVLGTVVAVLAFAPWLELPDSLDAILNETARVGYVNSLPDTLVVMLANAVGMPLDPARTVERVVILGGFGLYLLWETRQVWSEPGRGTVAGALARSSLAYVLLVSTSFQPWYFCLPLSVALALGWRRRIARLTLAYAAASLPALYLSYYLRDLTPGWVFIVYTCVPLLVVAPTSLRRGWPPRPERLQPFQQETPPTPAPSSPG
jgi:hypothetical protein